MTGREREKTVNSEFSGVHGSHYFLALKVREYTISAVYSPTKARNPYLEIGLHSLNSTDIRVYSPFKNYILTYVYDCLSCMCVVVQLGSYGGQKRLRDSLKLQLKTILSHCGFWEQNPGTR